MLAQAYVDVFAFLQLPNLAATASEPDSDSRRFPREVFKAACRPSLQVLLGVIIDSVWPPTQSAEACARGAVAKYMVETQAEQVQRLLLNRDAQVTVGGPLAGARAEEWSGW